MTLVKSNKSLLTGKKGQVALFVALMFQVLFLFFAMIVNVGLVVHHKINLQNSVDMAAYYGAMKQAELLNSIGHINYQMHQSWKLLAWRYRVLGTAGDDVRHPYDHASSKNMRANKDVETSNDTDGNYTRPPFCITYPPFNDSSKQSVPPGENTCKTVLDPAGPTMIRLFSAPPVVAGFISFAAVTAAISANMRNSAVQRCIAVGPLNYLTVGNFLFSYQLDQYARRLVIARISKSMSKNKNDFDDLDGKSVKTGAEETFKRNLTDANKEGQSLTFEMYNSLSNPGCGQVPGDSPLEYAAPWLSEIRAFPTIFYMDMECDASVGHLGKQPRKFELNDPSNPRSPANADSMPYSYRNFKVPYLDGQIEYIARNLNLYSENQRFILGFEKNPWCQAYVGAKASTKPKIPFAPSDLTLTAEAYAKPFGGKIGPWYYKRWGPTDQESTGSIVDVTTHLDPNLPMRIKDVSVIQNDPALSSSPLRVANYSKYIGDPYGLKSWRSMGLFARTLYNLSPQAAYRTIGGATSPTDLKLLSNDPSALQLDDWFEIAKPIQSNTAKDILAWNNLEDREPSIRTLEVAGLAPDQFDLAYYSIEPNFYDNYYKRMKVGIIQKLGINDSFFRPDLGARVGNNLLEKFSVKDQIKLVKDISPPVLDFQTKLTYAVINPVHVLTSWSNKSLFDYDKVADDYFGNCVAPNTDKHNYTDPQTNSRFQLNPGESVPGECVTGGRTGYSVKIISKDYLFAPVKVGGDASGESMILNPPRDF